MKSVQALQLIRKAARGAGLYVAELPSRGKGSHRIYALFDSAGQEIRRFGMTSHPRDLSWKVLQSIEDALEEHFGKKWMEKR